MNKKTLVLGASLKSDRYSNFAIHKLVNHNIETVAFGLKKGLLQVLNIDTDMLAFKDIHTVTLYLNPKNQKIILRLYRFFKTRTRYF